MSDPAIEQTRLEAERYAEAALDGKQMALFDYYDVLALVALAYLDGQRAGISWVRESVL